MTSSNQVSPPFPHRHPYPPLERKYKFRFRSPYLTHYEVSWGQFKTERLENYKWNNLDNYISFKGDQKEEYKLLEVSCFLSLLETSVLAGGDPQV